MAAEKGAGVLPFVHFGQEVYDYVNFVDARAGDNIAGNVGALTRFYKSTPAPPHLGLRHYLGVHDSQLVSNAAVPLPFINPAMEQPNVPASALVEHADMH